MNAKDQALFDTTIAELTAEFKLALTEAVRPLVIEITELQQRSSNYAARMNSHNKILRGEITSLRSRLEALEPKARVPVAPRLSDAEWGDAYAAMCEESKRAGSNKTYFHHSLVRAKAEEMKTCRSESSLALFGLIPQRR